MAQGYAVFIGLVVIAALCVASWFLAPKGENQVSVYQSRRCDACQAACDSTADPFFLQTLAILCYPGHRELLPYVGDYVPRPTSPSYCAEKKRYPRRAPPLDTRLEYMPRKSWKDDEGCCDGTVVILHCWTFET
ncbi:hypothetical protein LB504_009925 [Fusarium proliferatum]|nr:hypothetical protein LB504_009925 [Fusarium proliferatum]